MSTHPKSERIHRLPNESNPGDKRRKRTYKSFDFTVSKPMPIRDPSIFLRQSRPKRAVYLNLIEKIKSLKANENIFVSIPDGIDPIIMHNRINGACGEALKNPPKGTKFIKKTTADKKRIVILCVPTEGLFPPRE